MLISGLPGAGKTRLAHRLAAVLHLPVIDKDDILERLFDSKGTGDAVWRRSLSRESDLIFQREAVSSDGAILVSFWHLPGMPSDSGTPTGWLASLSGRIVNVHCACALEVAADRFLQRSRHPGHRDSERSLPDYLASLRALPPLPLSEIPQQICVDTSLEPNLSELVRDIREAFQRSSTTCGPEPHPPPNSPK